MTNENEIKTEKKEEGEQNENVVRNNLIEKAEELAKRLEIQNKSAEDILKRQEEFRAKQILSGVTDMGIQPAPPKKELTPKEYKDLVMKGIVPEKA